MSQCNDLDIYNCKFSNNFSPSAEMIFRQKLSKWFLNWFISVKLFEVYAVYYRLESKPPISKEFKDIGENYTKIFMLSFVRSNQSQFLLMKARIQFSLKSLMTNMRRSLCASKSKRLFRLIWGNLCWPKLQLFHFYIPNCQVQVYFFVKRKFDILWV